MEMPASFPQILHVGARERELLIVPADDISAPVRLVRHERQYLGWPLIKSVPG